MRFSPKTILLKDGRKCTLRPAVPDDAVQLIEYLKLTAAETPYLLKYPDEWTLTEEKERELLDGILDTEYCTMAVAETDGIIAGNSSINPVGGARRVRHRCSLAIALKKDYWSLGIGSALIQLQTELARQIGYEQMDLEYADGNDRARALYERCGFAETGRRHSSLKYDDGTYRDEILMYKSLK
ncbi:MAG: GNAT family N-acetyltransferase [Oscillospiraceae bacterium]|nr:GNAT family N-acetyltransferase [Oscillospiraceae bacterium]